MKLRMASLRVTTDFLSVKDYAYYCTVSKFSWTTSKNKKLSYRKETVRLLHNIDIMVI